MNDNFSKGMSYMKNINFIVWLLPIIFIIHDFEEIIMAEVWGKRYRNEIKIVFPKRKPFGLNYIQYCHTPTFTVAVELEFLLFTLISLFSAIFQSYVLWFGAFLGVIIHMIIIHIPLCTRFKNYVPGIITSVVLILPSIWILYIAAKIMNYGVGTIMLACVMGIALMIAIIPALHKLMGSWSIWLHKYSEVQKKG